MRANQVFIALLAVVLVSTGALSSDSAAQDADPSAAPPSMQDISGRWSKKVGDDEFVLDINKSRFVLEGKVAGRGVSTMRADDVQLSKDGILFGVVRSIAWKGLDGSISMHKDQLRPFAMRCRVLGESLSVPDVRFFGVDSAGHLAMIGVYEHIQPALAAAKVKPASANETQRK